MAIGLTPAFLWIGQNNLASGVILVKEEEGFSSCGSMQGQ